MNSGEQTVLADLLRFVSELAFFQETITLLTKKMTWHVVGAKSIINITYTHNSNNALHLATNSSVKRCQHSARTLTAALVPVRASASTAPKWEVSQVPAEPSQKTCKHHLFQCEPAKFHHQGCHLTSNAFLPATKAHESSFLNDQ